jgi:hypothetical protein
MQYYQFSNSRANDLEINTAGITVCYREVIAGDCDAGCLLFNME